MYVTLTNILHIYSLLDVSVSLPLEFNQIKFGSFSIYITKLKNETATLNLTNDISVTVKVDNNNNGDLDAYDGIFNLIPTLDDGQTFEQTIQDRKNNKDDCKQSTLSDTLSLAVDINGINTDDLQNNITV